MKVIANWLYLSVTDGDFCNDWLGHMSYKLGKTLYEASGCGTRMSDDTVFLLTMIPITIAIFTWHYIVLRREAQTQ